MVLLLVALVLGWALLSVTIAVGCGRAFAAGSRAAGPRLSPGDLELAA